MTDSTPVGAAPRRRFGAEIWIVLGLSLGQSAVYAVVSLVIKLTSGPLRSSTATLNASRSDRSWLDLTLQLLSIGFALVPVALALYLLSLDQDSPVRHKLGLDRTRPWREVAVGAGLAALIGLPGLAFYAAGRALGITANIIAAPDVSHWWTIPVLILAAIQNSLVEEIIVVGFLMTRLRQLRWSVVSVVITSALIRGSYHLYQGIGPGIGNAVMGVIFSLWFLRTRRVLPLVIAHTILDVVAFVGYLLFADQLGLR